MKNKRNYTKHGKSNTKIYHIWEHIIGRCTKKTHQLYKYYGGRGITVCEEWKIFINFYNDMGEAPRGLTLDRINNNDGYYKQNCRWATMKEQVNNRRKWGTAL